MKIKLYIIIISGLMLMNCTSFKDSSKGGVLNYLEYKSKKFRKHLKEECLFSENEINTLIEITDKNFIKNDEDKNKFVRIHKAVSSNGKAINENMFGLFVFNSSDPYPNFFFLRTEVDIVYFKCNDKSEYEKILKKSSKINDSIKKNINNYINDRCLDGDNMNWMNGRVW